MPEVIIRPFEEKPSQFFQMFLEVPGDLRRDKGIHEALVRRWKRAKNHGNMRFPGFFYARIFLISFR